MQLFMCVDWHSVDVLSLRLCVLKGILPDVVICQSSTLHNRYGPDVQIYTCSTVIITYSTPTPTPTPGSFFYYTSLLLTKFALHLPHFFPQAINLTL